MREIKFRAWNESANRYSNGSFSISDLLGTLPFVLNFTDDDGLGVIKSYTNEILEQYTGLKDKNGIEIYEGDIIKNHQAEENTVIWYGNGWCYENYHANALPLDDTWNPYTHPENTEHEIIGNIHEGLTLKTK